MCRSSAAVVDIEPPAPSLYMTEVLDKAAPSGFSRFERFSVRRPLNPRRARSAKYALPFPRIGTSQPSYQRGGAGRLEKALLLASSEVESEFVSELAES